MFERGPDGSPTATVLQSSGQHRPALEIHGCLGLELRGDGAPARARGGDPSRKARSVASLDLVRQLDRSKRVESEAREGEIGGDRGGGHAELRGDARNDPIARAEAVGEALG